MRCNHIESRRQRSDMGLIGARDACSIIRAGIAFLQPFPLRVADIATLPHRDERRYEPNKVAMRASACPSG